jgi:hypothetical protein
MTLEQLDTDPQWKLYKISYVGTDSTWIDKLPTQVIYRDPKAIGKSEP